MNANGSASYAQLRAGVKAKADFSKFEQSGGYNPAQSAVSAGPGHSEGTMGSTQFIFTTKELSGGKPASYSSATSTSVYGARSSTPTTNPAKPLGD